MTTLYRIPGTDYRYKIDATGVDKIVVGDVIGLFTDYAPIGFDVDWDSSYIDLAPFSNQDRTVTISAYNAVGDLLFEQAVEIVRPYATPPIGATEAEVTDFYAKESIARTVIDSLTGGFYLRRKMIGYESMGGDIIPLKDNIIKIFRVWENGRLAFDVTSASFEHTKLFFISSDRSSIIAHTGQVNRIAGNSSRAGWAPSDYTRETYDSIDMSRPYTSGSFPKGFDYVLDVLLGYVYLPSEITTATNLLINSGQCTDQYLNRYITEYDTDQYRIKYSKEALDGTGNRQVDMILAPFINSNGAIRAGVM